MWRGWSTGPDADVLLGGPANPNYGSHQGRDLGVFSWLGQSWQRGGGTVSGWVAWDSTLDLVYYGTDEPAPPDAARRTGENKWTATLFAREVLTGRVRWAYQVTPHDQWGFGASNENILVDLTVRGAPVRALVHFDRNGFAYTLDRATGKVLVAEKFGPANWARTVDLGNGLPVLLPAPPPAAGSCPAAIGTKFLQPAAFSALTRLFYLPLNNVCQDPKSGAMTAGPGGNRGRFVAWDATNATVAWEVREPLPVAGGALATAGGVVFYGTLDGWLKALDQRSGRELWRFKAPAGIVGNPITWLGPDGRQYLGVYAGPGGWWMQAAGLAPADSAAAPPAQGSLLVFGLP
jgi:PQQ-dependent dehydrogenase (methanol/ethanol family)